MNIFRSEHSFSCFAACLSMTTFNLTDIMVSQKNICDFLGLGLPNDSIDLIAKLDLKNVFVTDNSKEWGLDVDTTKINDLLLNYNVPLVCEFKSTLEFFDFEFDEYLTGLTTENKYPIIGFDYGYYTNGDNSQVYGHTIVGLTVKQQSLTAFDPGPKLFGVKNYDLYDLFVASKRKKGGIWSFKKK